MAVPHEQLDEDAEVLDWFLRRHGSRTSKADAPIRRWIASLRAYAARERGQNVPCSENLVGEGSLAALCDLFAARLSAHCVRAIEGAAEEGRIGKLDIHASFVDRELAGRDRTERGLPAMPASTGTLFAAANCARTGGDTLTIFGNDETAGAGLDVEFTFGTAIVRFECKSRAFADAFAKSATFDSALNHAAGKIVGAADALRRRTKRDGVAALQAIHICSFVPVQFCRQLHNEQLQLLLQQRLLNTVPYAQPHAIIVRWLGVDMDGAVSTPNNYQRQLDVPGARPRPNREAITLFHRLVQRPATAPRGLVPRP